MKHIKYCLLPAILFLIIFSQDASAQLTGAQTTFENPIKFDTVEDALGNVLTVIQGIVGVLAVLMIVVGGIIYITSGGDQGRVQLAKTAVTAAIIGFALAIAAPTFLFEVYNVLGQGANPPAAAQNAKPLSAIALDTLSVLLGIIGTLSVLMLVVGGILYLTAAGDQTRVDTARKTIQYAIIGLIIALLSLVIVTQIANVF